MSFSAWRPLLLAGILCAAAWTGQAVAQDQGTSQTGSLSGRVISRDTRSGIPSARVEVLGTDRAAVTGESGSFVTEAG